MRDSGALARAPMNAFLETFFKPNLIAQYLPSIIKGVIVTIEIAVAVVICGLLLGLLLAIVRSFQVKVLNALIVIFVDMLRALPPLVIVLIVYFGLPNVGINIPSFAVLWLVLTLVLASFAEEIFWAGILSVPKGQWEAARSTGFGFLGTLGWIVLPQAVRLTVPPITNRTVAITKNTALGTVIGVGEILNQATTAQSFAGNATYPKTQNIRDVAKEIPLDRILIETDSPFLAPQPYRGKRNEPAYVAEVAKTLATVRNLAPEEIAAATAANFRRLFRIARPDIS